MAWWLRSKNFQPSSRNFQSNGKNQKAIPARREANGSPEALPFAVFSSPSGLDCELIESCFLKFES
jgi:hypothetical protein